MPKKKKSDKEDNIFFSIIDDECEYSSENVDLTEIINELNQVEFMCENDDLLIPQIIHYKENYTVKDLLLICEYYGVAKELKTHKCTKDEIIHFLVVYESNPNNSNLVFKRQNMWFYINELKNDKFMKKYVLF